MNMDDTLSVWHYYKSRLPYRTIYIGYLEIDVVHDAVIFLKLMPSI